MRCIRSSSSRPSSTSIVSLAGVVVVCAIASAPGRGWTALRAIAGCEVRVDCLATFGGPLVGGLDELQRIAVRVGEVHPAPAGERPLIDDVNRGEEAHAPSLELTHACL